MTKQNLLDRMRELDACGDANEWVYSQEGKAQEIKGEAQRAVGNAKEAVKDVANKAADAANKNL